MSYFGEERAKWVIVTREWLDAGIPDAISSDAPTMPQHPLQVTIAGAISHMTSERKLNLPNQVMTPMEALRAHTLTAVYIGHEEAIKGSLEPGKLADVVVWAQDPTALGFQQMINTAYYPEQLENTLCAFNGYWTNPLLPFAGQSLVRFG